MLDQTDRGKEERGRTMPYTHSSHFYRTSERENQILHEKGKIMLLRTRCGAQGSCALSLEVRCR
jgi:hypothetical protein